MYLLHQAVPLQFSAATRLLPAGSGGSGYRQFRLFADALQETGHAPDCVVNERSACRQGKAGSSNHSLQDRREHTNGGGPKTEVQASEKIEIGSEIEYNYGDAKWPWRRKVKDPQTPAAAVEKETSPVHRMCYPQTPAAAVEKETSPVHQMGYKASKPDETNAQVKDPQTSAAAVEKETSPVHQICYPQTPAAAVEKETSPVHQMCCKASKPDETNAQPYGAPPCGSH
ncbi:Hypothetical protein SMAX5B_007039 [Scophthalmus maximus]|uniref:Uncharacterized protein n=1 Tax=Scophthalmus maximus TaxID=52904 RepID=A0A2U9B3N4_SCOMX|nr:Hypothetical protein SMAX5B_007039 [Scophthalmus maximus]